MDQKKLLMIYSDWLTRKYGLPISKDLIEKEVTIFLKELKS
jgi:hypothetical protein